MSWRKSLQLFSRDWVSRYIQRSVAYSHEDFLKAMIVQILRPGMLDINLTPNEIADLRGQLERISKIFYYGRTQKEVDVFSYTLSKVLEPFILPHEKRLKRKPASVSSQTKAKLEFELSQGKCENEAIRATAKGLHEVAKKKKAAAFLRRAAKDPGLREALSLPENVLSEIPETDIRTKMLRTLTNTQTKKKSFQTALRDALPFSDKNIVSAIGEDLSRLCRVVGYWDKLHQCILVLPVSPTAAQELQYRKSELLVKLKQIPEFRGVKDIRFQARG